MEELENLPEQPALPEETAEQALNRGRIAQDEDRFEDAVEAYEAAIELAEQAGDDKTIATALFNIGSVQFIHKFPESALDNFQEAFVHYERAGLQEGMVDSLHAQSEVLISQGDFSGATGCLHRVLPLQQAPEQAAGLGYTWKQLARLSHHRGDNGRAEEEYRKALLAFETAGNTWEVADCHFKIGFIYKWKNDWAKALETFETALIPAQHAGDEFLVQSIEDSVEEAREKLDAAQQKGTQKKGLFGRLFG